MSDVEKSIRMMCGQALMKWYKRESSREERLCGICLERYAQYDEKEGTLYDAIPCAYSDGYVTFETTHLSEYDVMANKSAEPSSGTFSVGIIIGGVIAVIAITVVATIVIKAKKKGSKQ